MKKFLSVLLCLLMVISVIAPAASAAETEPAQLVAEDAAEALKLSGKDYPIVFVTGIGQTFSYYLDDNGDNVMYLHGEKHNYSSRGNLFLFDTDLFDAISDIFGEIFDGTVTAEDAINLLKKAKSSRVILNSFGTAEGAANFVKVLDELIFTLSTGYYTVDYDDLCTLAKGLLKDNIIDENGKLPDYILSSTYECPVSEFDVDPDGTENGGYGKGRFYRDIPCKEIIADIGEDRVFCYNYPAFGDLSKISAGLDHLINDVILGEDGYFPDAEKVVLVPMSMGAAMVSQYLYDCEQAGKDPHVARVVSIVGCWNGSDIMADLIERKYAENSAEQFYTRWPAVTGDIVKGTILNNVWHLFNHDVLSRLVSDVLGAVCDELVLKTPSLLALIPSDRYDAIRETYLTRPGYEKVLEQLDKYHQVQLHLQERMEKFNDLYGMEFYFISGYGLDLGGGAEAFANSGDNYSIFSFLYSANKVNSDEIIPIQSTAPGASWVKAGDTFSGEYISEAQAKGTDKYIDTKSSSVDLSTCYYPDHTWIFYKQVHQLENNSTAIGLAFKIATGEINSVNDCKETYPQFNDSREIRYIRSSIEWLEKNIIGNPAAAEYEAEAKALIKEGNDIIASTINNRAAEDEFTAEIQKFCDDVKKALEGKEEEESEPTYWEQNGDKILTTFNDVMYKIFGYKGFPDIRDMFIKLFGAFVQTVLNIFITNV